MKFKSQVYTQASGSIGGVTYSHNKGGMYTRGRSIPVNPNTTRQQAVRAQMTTLVQAWTNDLSAAERTAWSTYAANTPVLNVFGDSINLTGQQMYIRSNVPRLQLGASTLTSGTNANTRQDTAPTVFNTGVPPNVVNTQEADGTNYQLQVGFGSPQPDEGTVLLFVGVPQNAGRNYFKGPYQLAAAADFSATSVLGDFSIITLATATEWVSAILPNGGDYLPIRLNVATADGRLSTSYRLLSVIDTYST